MSFEIIEAKIHHCGMMARLLRYEHHEALARLGADPHRELRACFDQSAFRRAWLIDGRIAALGGVTGTALAADGQIWLAASQRATRFPRAMIEEARRQLDVIMVVKRNLTTAILVGDRAAARFAVFLGFHVDHFGWPGAVESRYGRQFMIRRLDDDEEARIPRGNGYMIPLAYRAA